MKQESDDIPRVVALLFVGAFFVGVLIGYFNRGFGLFSAASDQRSSQSSSQSVAPSQREPQSRPTPAPKPIAELSLPSSPPPSAPGSPPATAPASPPAAVSSSGGPKSAGGEPTAIFHVQVGAFRHRENAEILVQRLHRDGFQAYINYVAGLHRVQIGTFTDRADADRLAEELRAKDYDVFVTR